MMGAVRNSVMLVNFCKTTQHNSPQGCHLQVKNNFSSTMKVSDRISKVFTSSMNNLRSSTVMCVFFSDMRVSKILRGDTDILSCFTKETHLVVYICFSLYQNSNPQHFFKFLTFLKHLPDFTKYICQVTSKLVYPFSSYKQTYIHTYTILILYIRFLETLENTKEIIIKDCICLFLYLPKKGLC
jgi:hypothetical protein